MTWRQVVKEYVEGKYPESFEVIDIGAGHTPSEGATRAVDSNRNLFTKSGKGLKKKVAIPKSLKEYVNYDASNLPYEDEFFDRGISKWAIGARIMGIEPVRELYRVLKNGGEVYIAILEEDKKGVPITKENLRRVGFTVLKTYTGEYTETTNIKIEYVVHARK